MFYTPLKLVAFSVFSLLPNLSTNYESTEVFHSEIRRTEREAQGIMVVILLSCKIRPQAGKRRGQQQVIYFLSNEKLGTV